jgi:two-component system sensor histidine kinase/response regulator
MRCFPPVECSFGVNRRLRILLAEDNTSNQLIAATRLERMGHRVDVVSNGIEAVDAVRLAPVQYDLVLMDMMMPEMGGLEATEEIRRLSSQGWAVPIVALTANAFRRDEIQCLAAGMDGFISKPIAAESLISVLDRVLNGTMRRGEVVTPGHSRPPHRVRTKMAETQ